MATLDELRIENLFHLTPDRHEAVGRSVGRSSATFRNHFPLSYDASGNRRGQIAAGSRTIKINFGKKLSQTEVLSRSVFFAC